MEIFTHDPARGPRINMNIDQKVVSDAFRRSAGPRRVETNQVKQPAGG